MERMKSNKSFILTMVLMISMVSFSCSLFTQSEELTPEPPEPTFEPVTDLLVIEPAALPGAQMGLLYEAEIHITQNVTPVGDMVITNGVLPSGMELVFMEGENSATISGIPDETGTFTFTLYVWCYGTQVSGQTLEKDFQIVVEE